MAARRCYATSSLDAYAKLNTRSWKGTSVDGTAVKNFIGGKFVASKAEKHFDVLNPVCLCCDVRVGAQWGWD